MLRWTSEPPTEEGWYWWREGPASATIEIVEIRGKVAFFLNRYGRSVARTAPYYRGQWWPAPIAPPQEEE